MPQSCWAICVWFLQGLGWVPSVPLTVCLINLFWNIPGYAFAWSKLSHLFLKHGFRMGTSLNWITHCVFLLLPLSSLNDSHDSTIYWLSSKLPVWIYFLLLLSEPCFFSFSSSVTYHSNGICYGFPFLLWLVSFIELQEVLRYNRGHIISQNISHLSFCMLIWFFRTNLELAGNPEGNPVLTPSCLLKAALHGKLQTI